MPIFCSKIQYRIYTTLDWLSRLPSSVRFTTPSQSFSFSLSMTFMALWSISGHPVECPAVRDSLMSSHDSTGVTGFGEGYYRGEVPFLYHLISGGRLCRYDMNDVGLHHLAKAGFPRFLRAKVILFTLPYSILWKQITESNPHYVGLEVRRTSSILQKGDYLPMLLGYFGTEVSSCAFIYSIIYVY